MKEDIWLCSFCHQQNAVDIGVQDLRVQTCVPHKQRQAFARRIVNPEQPLGNRLLLVQSTGSCQSATKQCIRRHERFWHYNQRHTLQNIPHMLSIYITVAAPFKGSLRCCEECTTGALCSHALQEGPFTARLTARAVLDILDIHCCVQSAAELQVEAVDYIQPDMTGQPVSQTAETLALLVDTTAGAAELQAAKTIIKQVLPIVTCCSNQAAPKPTLLASATASLVFNLISCLSASPFGCNAAPGMRQHSLDCASPQQYLYLQSKTSYHSASCVLAASSAAAQGLATDAPDLQQRCFGVPAGT